MLLRSGRKQQAVVAKQKDQEAAQRRARNQQGGKTQANARSVILRAPAKREFTRRVYRTPTDQRIWGADLLDMSKAAGSMRGYALVTVDYLTRQQRWELMDTKTTKAIERAFETVFARAGMQPAKIHSDKESGLVHSGLMRELGITIYHAGPGSHSYLAENAIKQFRARLPPGTSWKQPIRDGTYEQRYNSTNKMMSLGKHTPDQLAKMPPDEVQGLHKAREDERDAEAPENPKLLKEGARVLVVRQRGVFEKKTGADNWGRKIHEVVAAHVKPGPVMYSVKPVGGEPLANRLYREQIKVLTPAQEVLFMR